VIEKVAATVPPFSGRLRRFRPRPGLRTLVLGGSALVVLALSAGISVNVSDHLRDSASQSATRSVEAIVRGYVDPIFRSDSLDISSRLDPEVDEQLARLVASGDMRRINIWTRDGRVMYSTESSMQGTRHDIDHDLAQAFAGMPHAAFGERLDEGPASERLPDEFLGIFTPIRGDADGAPIGVFEVYLDARPIADRVADTRNEIFLITLAGGAVLLGLLWLAFGGASRLLSTQNRRLTQLNDRLNALTVDLGRSEARFRSLVQKSSDVVLVIGPDGVTTYVSEAIERVLGAPQMQVGKHFLESVHPGDRALIAGVLDGLLVSPGTEHAAELRLPHADGTWRWVEAIGQNLMHDPAVAGVVFNFRDVTDRKRLESQLQHDAFHDSLTGLANRALFSDRVTHALARSGKGRRRRRTAVLFIDLDDFKVVNDSLGHMAGDALLTGVAQRVSACVRESNTAARLGGDEFGILLDEATRESAKEVAERILESLRQPIPLADRQIFVEASIGIALNEGRDSISAEELLRNADAAMYTAKARGKGQVAFYEATMHASALRRLELRGRLEASLEARELVLEYQPIIELATSDLAGVEALVRWRQPDGRLSPPSEFVPLAEETGLIVPLGQWVLQEACAQAVEWPRLPSGARMSMAVNVSSRQLQDPGFPQFVRNLVEQSTLKPGDLVIEVTESALLEEGDPTTTAITQLTEIGVRIALDDFGTGYSSLSHLRRFPIDILKIDRSFVDGIDGADQDERALVRSIVRLAHSLRLETVAEGIERPEQLVPLRALGVRFGQGFHFARPMDAASMADYLRRAASLAS